MRVVRWRRRTVIKLAVVIFLFGLFGYGLHWISKVFADAKCSNASSRQMLDALCKLYRKNKVGGNLCSDLCDIKSIKFTKCLNYRGGKRIFIAMWNMRKIILKSKKGYLGDYNPIWFQEGETFLYPTMLQFAETMRNSIQERIGIQLPSAMDPKALVNEIWSVDYDNYFNNAFQKNAVESGLDSIYSLLQQDEYVLMKHFQASEFFPDIYGTCGHFYAMEFVPPGDVLDPIVFSINDKSTWNQRRTIALKVLDLVYHFEHNFHQTLHLCDVKNENFGLTVSGGVKAIDVDMAYFDKNLKSIQEQENCTQHSTCDFFDCKGWCNFKTGRCTNQRINNNLQVICSDVMQHKFGNAFKGLLRRPPEQLQTKFKQVLHECANPTDSKDADIRYKATEETFWKLYNLLQESNSDLLPKENSYQRHDHEH